MELFTPMFPSPGTVFNKLAVWRAHHAKHRVGARASLINILYFAWCARQTASLSNMVLGLGPKLQYAGFVAGAEKAPRKRGVHARYGQRHEEELGAEECAWRAHPRHHLPRRRLQQAVHLGAFSSRLFFFC